MSKSNVTSISNDEEYESAVSSGTVIIKFSGTWCAPCKRISLPYEKLANVHTKIRFYQLDIDDAPKVTTKEQISAIPAFIIYHNGERLSSYVGASEKNLSETIITGLNYIDNKSSLLEDPINGKLSTLSLDDNSDLDI